jgi:hypothetical protein
MHGSNHAESQALAVQLYFRTLLLHPTRTQNVESWQLEAESRGWADMQPFPHLGQADRGGGAAAARPQGHRPRAHPNTKP